MIFSAAALLCALQEAPTVPPDTVTLENGRTREGVVLFADEETLWLGVGTRVREVPREDIAQVSGPRIAYFSDYLPRLQFAYSDKAAPADAYALAEWCREQGLMRDVELHLWRTLALDPEHEQAHRELGHEHRDGEWRRRLPRGGWMDMEELHQRRLDFADGWNFTTMHFDVQAAGDLPDVLYSCVTLELVYLRIYGLLQEKARFHELLHPIRVFLYRDRDSDYPEISPTVNGYYDQNNYFIHGYFDGDRVVNLERITAHAVVHRACYEITRSQPIFPGWLYHGLGTYVQGCFEEVEGVPLWRPGWIVRRYFKAHAELEDPESLSRVINLAPADFDSVNDEHPFYAQSYTLVFYLLHAESLDVIEGFQRYLASAFRSKGTISDFKDAMGRRTYRSLEERWNEYVEDRAPDRP